MTLWGIIYNILEINLLKKIPDKKWLKSPKKGNLQEQRNSSIYSGHSTGLRKAMIIFIIKIFSMNLNIF